MNVIFDLDGTLIDASDRMFELFQHLVTESSFTKEEYWELKRNCIDHQTILKRFFPNVDFHDFRDKWMKLIEDEQYLDLDRYYCDTVKTLERISDNNIVLLTARQSKQNLLRELKKMGLSGLFNMILVTEMKNDKYTLLSNNIEKGCICKSPEDVFVSDMGKDIKSGNELGFITIAITHGFMSKESLMKYKPAYIIDELSEIVEIIHRLKKESVMQP